MKYCIALLAFTFLGGAFSFGADKPYFQDGEEPDTEGKQWVKNKDYSDEFNGKKLDKKKWHDHHPYWKGRPPAKFMPNGLSFGEGKLMMKNKTLKKPDGEYTIGGAAIVSKGKAAHYGYYECRMKASRIAMSSTFWMKNLSNRKAFPSSRTELDIIECIGGATTHKKFATHMNSNTHYMYNDGENPTDWKSIGDNAPVGGNVADDYHVYGAWWKDANTILFYIDGVYQYTINPDTTYDPHPFSRPMYICMVTETYNWQPAPSTEDLADDSINTTYYDWVRAWTLK